MTAEAKRDALATARATLEDSRFTLVNRVRLPINIGGPLAPRIRASCAQGVGAPWRRRAAPSPVILTDVHLLSFLTWRRRSFKANKSRSIMDAQTETNNTSDVATSEANAPKKTKDLPNKLVSLQELCSELEIDGMKAGRLLRAFGIKHKHGK
jgi:hypothetical protein